MSKKFERFLESAASTIDSSGLILAYPGIAPFREIIDLPVNRPLRYPWEVLEDIHHQRALALVVGNPVQGSALSPGWEVLPEGR